MERITRSAVELRLKEPWPEALDRKELAAPAAMNQGIAMATDVFVQFMEAHQVHASGRSLTDGTKRQRTDPVVDISHAT